MGSGLDFESDIGSLASQQQLDRVVSHVSDAVENGARILAGGKARPELGPYFFEPTVMDRVVEGMTSQNMLSVISQKIMVISQSAVNYLMV